jgi:hypothetical protein
LFFPLCSGNNLNHEAPELTKSEITRYEKHHNNNTNDVKNIHVSLSSLSRDRIIFKIFSLILGETTHNYVNVVANSLPKAEPELEAWIYD